MVEEASAAGAHAGGVASPIPRPTARILLVDDRDRLLLFSFVGDPARWWLTPGGRVNDGETLPEAAIRELREETGNVLGIEDLGPVVAVCSGEWRTGSRAYLDHDSFYFVRAPIAVVDSSGQEEAARRFLTGHRWWTLAELEATQESVVPIGLAGLIAQLLAGDLPAEPVRLPWRTVDPPA